VPAPPDVEEFLIAGFLRGKPVELVQCETVDLQVPACAEIVLEGYVELNELRTEGPFGDHTGFYTLTDEYPVFHLTCITHRKESDLRGHRRRQAPHGGRLDGQGRRAHLLAR
jgi:4-hydroxy-3-polyprenylbenzoate decarboxylase